MKTAIEHMKYYEIFLTAVIFMVVLFFFYLTGIEKLS